MVWILAGRQAHGPDFQAIEYGCAYQMLDPQ